MYFPFALLLFHRRRTGRVLVPCRTATRQSKRKNPLFRISNEAVGMALGEIRREEVRMHFPCQVSSPFRTSYIPLDDCFAAMQILRRSGVDVDVGSHEVA